MKLTARGHYSVKALLDLAIHRQCGPQPIRAIAERQNIPKHFLEQLLIILRRGGFVRSERGARGGYTLARPPEQIRLGEVLRAVGGCPGRGGEPDGRRGTAEDWVTVALWMRLHRSLEAALDGISLQDLYFDARSHQAAQGEEGRFVV